MELRGKPACFRPLPPDPDNAGAGSFYKEEFAVAGGAPLLFFGRCSFWYCIVVTHLLLQVATQGVELEFRQI